MVTLLAPVVAILAGAPPATAPGAPPAAAAARVERAAKGSILERAEADLVKIKRALDEVLSRVEDARNEKDIVKLLCADEKLAQMKVLVSVAERAEVALAEAVSSSDESIDVEASKVSIARGKVDALRAEAAACIGQLAYEVRERTSVTVEVPSDLPELETHRIVRDQPGADRYRIPFGIPSQARR